MKNITAIAVHGLYTNHIYFAEMAKFYIKHGIEVKSYDLMGFGRTTTSNRGDIESFNEYIFQTVNVILETKAKTPGHKIIVVGENIGGLVAMLTAVKTKNEIDALIVMNPVTDAHYPFSKMKSVEFSLSTMFNRDKKFDILTEMNDICNDEKMKEILSKDEFRITRITARFWWALLNATVELKKNIGRITAPTLIQVSKSGKINSKHITKDLFFKIQNLHKHLQEIDAPDALSICRDRDAVFEKHIKFLALVFPDNV